MGLRKAYIEFIMEHAGPVRCKTMLELGNQKARGEIATVYDTGKEFWSAAGVIHTSIDLNGKDGAIPLDLGKPIDKFNNQFDIVTDIGTSCYIRNYMQCWQNMQSFAKCGGMIIHILPEVGSRWTALHFVDELEMSIFASNCNCFLKSNTTIETEYGILRAAALIKR